MHGLTVHNIHLDQVLAPVAISLDACWWNLDGAGMSFPWVRPPTRLPPEPPKPRRRGPGRHTFSAPPLFDPPDWQRYLDESRAAREEYDHWIELLGSNRIGKPGFFRRYAAGMNGDWQIYFASDAPTLETAGFAEADRLFNRVWFDPPPTAMPADICLITRDVDAAYLDLFFRDEWMYRTIFDLATAKGMHVEAFRNRFQLPPLARKSDRKNSKH
jgi:hypothetical protein